MGFRLKCSECRGSIPFDGKWPSECPFCHVKMEGGDDNVISVPAFLKKAKGVDQVYRDMEKGSEIRAQAAAEMLGVPVSEMSDLKITNMRDNAREGDIAAMPVSNPVTQQMDQLRSAGAAVGFQSDASHYGSAVQVGPGANRGAHVMSEMAALHGKISERPALETVQPGYRRRG